MNRQRQALIWTLLLVVALGGMILRVWRLGDLAVVGDESYFWLWSQRPALSYFDHPGGVAWLIGLSTALGGGTEFGIRWLNALLGMALILLIYGLGRRLQSPAAGLIAAAIVAVAPPYILTSRFVYTDTLPMFLLLLNLNLLWPLLADSRKGQPPQPGWRWLLVGLTWVLLLNTKISVYPYFLGLGIGVLLWRRELLRSTSFWLTVLGASVGLLPLLIWNATHQWVGLDWMWRHFSQGTIRATSPLSIIHHILTYFGPPLVLLCLPGLLLWRTPGKRWLVLISLLLILPVLLSPANSPRNLLLGCLPLIGLTGVWLTAPGRWPRWRMTLAMVLLVGTGVYGVGTTLALVGETSLPQSAVARAVREDAAGWRALGEELRAEDSLLFAIDYSIASQLWFYTERPAYTNWGQYLVWGIPDFQDAVVISLEHVPKDSVTLRLQGAFRQVEGPQQRRFQERGTVKEIRLWRVKGLKLAQETFLEQLDLMALLEDSR